MALSRVVIVFCIVITCFQPFSNPNSYASGKEDLQVGARSLLLSQGEKVDKDRVVVISHPYDDSGNSANVYELLVLSLAGELTSTGKTFEMGRGVNGDAVFTPDGRICIVRQDDGTLGVFRVDASGNPQVVYSAFNPGFVAGGLMMHPSGKFIYALCPQWKVNGGGIYKIGISTNGQLTNLGKMIEANMPAEMVATDDSADMTILAAGDIQGSAADDDIHLIRLEPQIARVSSANPFASDYLISSSTMTHDGKYVLFADNHLFVTPDSVAVLRVEADSVSEVMQMNYDTPISLQTSPYDNGAIVISDGQNAIYTSTYDPSNSVQPFAPGGELSYTGATPILPGKSVMIRMGQLTGRVLIVEYQAIRMVQFGQDGGVNDLGSWSTGSDLSSIVGVIGIQP